MRVLLVWALVVIAPVADAVAVSPLPQQKMNASGHSTLQLPVDENALVGKSVAEIVAFAQENPEAAVDIARAAALVAESPEQAAIVVKAIAEALPNQATAILAVLNQVLNMLSEFQSAINSKTQYSESTINATQDLVNNIQKSANQGIITQAEANALIALIVLRSGGGVTRPVSLY